VEAIDRADERFPAGLRTLDARAGFAGDDPALRALRDEGVGILGMGPTRRVIAAATRP
jgi:hypothetical protein